MKKKHKFNILSDKECEKNGCNKKLKLRLIEDKLPHNITICYKHYIEDKKKKIKT